MNVLSQEATITPNVGNTSFGTAGLTISILGWITCGLLSPIGVVLSLLGMIGLGSKSHAIAGLLVGIPGVCFLFYIVGRTPTPTPVVSSSNCKFVKSGTDLDGNFMQLYSTDSPASLQEFRNLCVTFRKERASQEKLQFLVLFDDEKSAIFPKDLYSTKYGDEIETAKHIKAFYTFNPLDSFSELITYSPGMDGDRLRTERP